MKTRSIIFSFFGILFIAVATLATTFIPSGDIDGRGIYQIMNFTNITADNINATIFWEKIDSSSFPASCPSYSAINTLNTSTTCLDAWIHRDGDLGMTGNFNFSTGNITSEKIITPDMVQYWGAVGDNITDDTSAIQNTINYVSNHNHNVYAPCGEFNISGLNIINSNVIINGAGSCTIFYITGENSYGFNIGNESMRIYDIELNNFRIIGHSEREGDSYNTSFSINTTNCNDCKFLNIEIEKGNYGIILDSKGSVAGQVMASVENDIDMCTIVNTSMVGIQISTTDSSSNNWNNYNRIRNTWIHHSKIGLYLTRDSSTGSVSSHKITDVYIESEKSGDDAIIMENADYNSFKGVTVDGHNLNETIITLDSFSDNNKFSDFDTVYGSYIDNNGDFNQFFDNEGLHDIRQLSIGTNNTNSYITIYEPDQVENNTAYWFESLTKEVGNQKNSTIGIKFGRSELTDRSAGIGSVYEATFGNQIGIGFWTYGSNIFSEKMRLTYNGKLGIGTESPTTELDIVGTITTDDIISGTYTFDTDATIISNTTCIILTSPSGTKNLTVCDI